MEAKLKEEAEALKERKMKEQSEARVKEVEKRLETIEKMREERLTTRGQKSVSQSNPHIIWMKEKNLIYCWIFENESECHTQSAYKLLIDCIPLLQIEEK